MALMRNLRNILIANPPNVNKVLEYIENPESVKKSRQLPFRYLSAYKELKDIGSSRVFDVLENALEASVENLPKLSGTTVIAVDTSGSMSSCVSAKSKVRCFEIALTLGLIANKICDNSIFYTFDDSIEKHSVSHKTAILESVSKSSCGGSTNMGLPFSQMINDNIKADRIIILSDNECNINYYWWCSEKSVQTLADEYRKMTGNDIWVHAIDLQGYGTQQFHGKKTNIIAGWSEKVFDFIKLAEQGESTLLRIIEKYTY